MPWHLRQVPDADWVRLTQSQFGPISVGERILIVPSWHAEQMPQTSEAGHIAIQLDPGLAFGTGSHPTTHLCLEWLADELVVGSTVLDYGCGSGILAIAAKMLGASSVTGIDIDEQAVQATADNAVANHTEINAHLPEGLVDGLFDVVLANILSNPLKVLAPMLSTRVRSGGCLVLSGVLERQALEVAQAYAPWLPMTVWQARDGWVCLAGRKP
jgi:ribosomal protein L11 methyltransferase